MSHCHPIDAFDPRTPGIHREVGTGDLCDTALLRAGLRHRRAIDDIGAGIVAARPGQLDHHRNSLADVWGEMQVRRSLRDLWGAEHWGTHDWAEFEAGAAPAYCLAVIADALAHQEGAPTALAWGAEALTVDPVYLRTQRRCSIAGAQWLGHVEAREGVAA
jgi:hypothetical protein